MNVLLYPGSPTQAKPKAACGVFPGVPDANQRSVCGGEKPRPRCAFMTQSGICSAECRRRVQRYCKFLTFATLRQSNNYGVPLMPRFAPIAPHRPIYWGLGVLIGFCVLSAGSVLLSPRSFRQCKGCVFPLSYASGLCHKEDVVSDGAYATVSVEDKIAIIVVPELRCRILIIMIVHGLIIRDH